MKNLQTFEDFVNENYSINEADVPKNYMKGGFHYIAIVDDDDALNPQFRKMKKKLIAVYGGLKYVYSVKKGKTLEKVLDPRLPIHQAAKMIYHVESGKFYSVSTQKEINKNTELPHPFINTKYSDVEQDFKVAATGHVNDYEQIGAEIKKVSESSINEDFKMEYKWFKDNWASDLDKDEILHTFAPRNASGSSVDAYIYVPDSVKDKFEKEVMSSGSNKYSEVDFGKGWTLYYSSKYDAVGFGHDWIYKKKGLKVTVNSMINK